MTRRIEQGSVLGFVLVGVVLVGLLAGGLYVVRQQQSGAMVTRDNQGHQEEASKNSGGAAGSSDDSAPRAMTDSQLKTALDEQSRASADHSSTDGSSNHASAQQLPETGPSQTIVSMLGIALIAGAGTAYVRSRQLL